MMKEWVEKFQYDIIFFETLTVTRPISLPPPATVAQKIADQRWLIANSAKNKYFLYKMMLLKLS